MWFLIYRVFVRAPRRQPTGAYQQTGDDGVVRSVTQPVGVIRHARSNDGLVRSASQHMPSKVKIYLV